MGRITVSNKDMNGLKVTNLGAPTAASNDAARIIDVETASTNDRARANHTGSQLASTISNFDAQVRTSRLDQMAAPTGSVSMNSQRLTAVADPSSDTDAANKQYVDTALATVASNLVLKGSVEVSVTTNVTISNPGTSTFDGQTVTSGSIVMLAGQTTASERGPYVFNGSSSALTRALNWNSDAEASIGSFWIVKRGTYADKIVVLTNDSAVTLGTTSLTFDYIGYTAGSSYTETNPTVSSGGSWTVTHNLGTRDVDFTVRRVASPYDFVDAYGEATSTSVVTIIPDSALTAGDFSVTVRR